MECSFKNIFNPLCQPALMPLEPDQTQLTLSIWIKDNVHFYDCKTSCRIALVRLVVATTTMYIVWLHLDNFKVELSEVGYYELS
jgi:hypothetical protein